MAKRPSLSDVIKSLRTDIEEAQLTLEDTKSISTGSLAADLVTGIGGFPRGRISEVSGWESSGKTTLALSACAKAQRQGHFVAYLDAEHGMDKTHAERLGFDFTDENKGLYMAPYTLEDTVKIVVELIETDACRLIVVDSVPGLVPKVELEGDLNEVGQIAHKARLLAAILPRLAVLINKHDTALVFVNQMRMKVSTGFQARFHPTTEQAAGGSALRFFAALRLKMELKKKGAITRQVPHELTGKVEDLPIANVHRVEAIKNKVSAPYRDAEFFLRYDSSGLYGIDNISTLINIAIARGVFVKSGSFFKYSGAQNFSLQGEERLYQHVFETPAVLTELCQTLEIEEGSVV